MVVGDPDNDEQIPEYQSHVYARALADGALKGERRRPKIKGRMLVSHSSTVLSVMLPRKSQRTSLGQ